MAVVGIILAMGLYAWAAALSSSQYSWSGDVDSRVTGVRWYDSEGEWERDLSNGDLEWSSGNQADYEELEVTSLHTSYDWPYASHKFRSDSSDWSTMNVEVHMQIIGDVWFVQITAVNFDGDYTSFDDGECYAIIHEDAYWGSSSWRQQVGSTSWPHFCDSVDDY